MFIQLETNYRNTNGVSIPAGLYDEDAPELHGLADYLVKTGHARSFEPPQPESGTVVEPNDGETYGSEDSHTITVTITDSNGEQTVQSTAVEPQDETPAVPEAQSYDALSLDELKAAVEANGMVVPTRPTKAKLIEILGASDSQ